MQLARMICLDHEKGTKGKKLGRLRGINARREQAGGRLKTIEDLGAVRRNSARRKNVGRPS